MTITQFRLTAGTDVGCIRTNNEDNFIANEDLTRPDWFVPQDTSAVINLGNDGCAFAVADGMGGLNAGEVASAIAVEEVKQQFMDADLSKLSQSKKGIEKFMNEIVVKADAKIKQHVTDNPSTEGMGTTIIIAWVLGNKVHLSWCGDSRGYMFNKESGLMRISKDHSYVQELVDAGKLDEDLAFDHPNSNIITRCLGDFKGKAQPEYRFYTLKRGDFILLCSDGLCSMCRDEEIENVMNSSCNNIEECKKQLIQHALQAGGHDNVTIALFEVVDTLKNNDVDNNINIDKNYDKSNRNNIIYFVLVLLALLVAIIFYCFK